MRLGLRHKAADFMLPFLQNVEYYIRSEYGTRSSYQINLLTAIYWVLQEGALNNALWLVDSTLLIDIFIETFLEKRLCNPNGTNFPQRNIVTFINDAHL